MASQEKLISCGPKLTIFAMILKFIAGPAAMAIASLVLGLHGDVLRVAIIQVLYTSFFVYQFYPKDLTYIHV